MAEWTEGVCADGAAILRDGEPVTIIELLTWLNGIDVYIERVEAALQQIACDECDDPQERAVRVLEGRPFSEPPPSDQ